MFFTIPEVFTKDQVRQIRDILATAPYEAQTKTGAGQAEARGPIKNNLQVPSGQPEVRPAAELISRTLLSHRDFAAIALPRKLRLLFNRYDTGMFYEAHTDAAIMPHGKGEIARNDMSFTVFLSEPEEYQGGDFVTDPPYGARRIREPAGNVILYSADTPHRVEEVREGARWAVVGWVESYIKDPLERALQHDMSLLMRDVAALGDADISRRFEGLRERLLRRWIDT
jgi:PKHD-type hydroxylase